MPTGNRERNPLPLRVQEVPARTLMAPLGLCGFSRTSVVARGMECSGWLQRAGEGGCVLRLTTRSQGREVPRRKRRVHSGSSYFLEGICYGSDGKL